METQKTILYVVMPCYNEDEVLPETSKQLREKCLELKEQISPLSRMFCQIDPKIRWEIMM